MRNSGEYPTFDIEGDVLTMQVSEDQSIKMLVAEAVEMARYILELCAPRYLSQPSAVHN